ncbi:MAG: DUF3048 domain-containing protein [Clostridia bacterium]|nr:DUF3048 domain-containing protein [Clostridia bacterium]
MFKKTLAFLLALSLILCVGCKSKEDKTEGGGDVVETEPLTVNSLTGLKDIPEDKLNARPVSVMVNNIRIAQDIQSGLADADIIYETEVEGGITRLMAVYKDISAVKQIGSVRSARYVYVDLSYGHNAIFIHSGSDPIYCRPRLASMDDIDIYTGYYGQKINNGKANDHTLYTFGDSVVSGIEKFKFSTTDDSNKTWLNFAEDGESVTLSGGTATELSVPFSSAYVTKFKYNSETGTYDRLIGNGTVQKDYTTGETVSVENVFVLLTSISDYADKEHRYVDLNGGDGYYFANGTYTFIKWKKGDANNSFTFTDVDGKELTVSAGSSWVCLADKQKCTPKYQ